MGVDSEHKCQGLPLRCEGSVRVQELLTHCIDVLATAFPGGLGTIPALRLLAHIPDQISAACVQDSGAH